MWVWIISVILVGGMGAMLVFMRQRLTAIQDELADCQHRQKDLHEAIERAEQVRDWLMNAIDGAIILLDSSQTVVMANPAALELAGGPMSGETLIAAIRHAPLDEFVQQTTLLADDEIAERLLEINGKLFQTRIRKLKDDQQVFQLLTLIDVTALKRAERARRDMVANISHELRHPITTISLLAETLEDDDVRKSKQGRKMIASIRRELDTLTQLVQEMRDLSRIESGQMPIKLTATSLKSAIQTGTEALLALAESKQQSLIVDVTDQITVLADETHIERVVKNIVHNAIKFTQEGGTIHLSANVTDGEVIVTIRDNGPGIPAEDLPRVFERFFQVDRARKDGTGLGLAIARHIILAHGGKIWVESTEGQGAAFFFSLRLATES